jgi:hypothetical protein
MDEVAGRLRTAPLEESRQLSHSDLVANGHAQTEVQTDYLVLLEARNVGAVFG